MNPFERHSITRLSPSSLNHYLASPAHWVMQRLLNLRAPASAAAARGSAVERGVHLGLINPGLPVETCIADAGIAFEREMVLTPDDRRETERANLAGYVTNALTELRPYGAPSAAQDRVEIWLDDIPVPIEGYADWVFDDHGADRRSEDDRAPPLVDLRHPRPPGRRLRRRMATTACASPTSSRSPARRTVAPSFVYEMSAEEVRRHLQALMQQIALRLGRFLSISSDPHELAGLLVPDFDHFWWSHPITRSHGRNLYGF